MASPEQTIGLASAILGAGMTGVRVAAKRFNYELPAWVDVTCGIGSLALIAMALVLLLRTFLNMIGAPIPFDSPWPGTLLYAMISVALIVGAGYLPARWPVGESTKKTKWDRAAAENLFLHLDEMQSPQTARIRVKVIATDQGKSPAEFLVKVLRRYGWEVEVNREDGSYIFPPKAPFRGVIMRYRKSQFNEYYSVNRIVGALVDSSDHVYFPEDEAFNFVQVEIGDIPEYYNGAPEFIT
jgi:hypothetical protein